MQVRVVYLDATQQFDRMLDVLPDTPVAAAILQSGIEAAIPKLKSQPRQIAIFGRRVSEHCLLQEGDRIEILRPLHPESHSLSLSRPEY